LRLKKGVGRGPNYPGHRAPLSGKEVAHGGNGGDGPSCLPQLGSPGQVVGRLAG
jgi:hypothetical protein